MANRPRKTKQQDLWSDLSVPILIVAAFGLGAGGTWLIMRTSSSGAPQKPAIKSFVPSPVAPPAQPPDVSQLVPADAARTLADWNYDRQNWAHAIEHYQEAIARGADNPDVRTDLGNCFWRNRRKRSSNTSSPKKKIRCTRTVFSIRSACLPKCCTMISALY